MKEQRELEQRLLLHQQRPSSSLLLLSYFFPRLRGKRGEEKEKRE